MEKERALVIELIEKGLSLDDIKRVLTGQRDGGTNHKIKVKK
jgi:DNA-binding transcriptional MerR regulator